MTYLSSKTGRQLASFAALCILSPLGVAQTTLISDVNGYTINADHQMVEFSALQFTDGIVDKLYSAGEQLPENEEIVRIDGEGKTLLSGLVDAHGHILSYGLSLLRVDLTGTTSEQEAVERIRAFREANGRIVPPWNLPVSMRPQQTQQAAKSYAIQRAALLARSSTTPWTWLPPISRS